MSSRLVIRIYGRVGLFMVAFGLWADAVSAASLASDSAADPVYNNGWQTGDNGGSGWGGGWTLAAGGVTGGVFAENFIGNSASNGVGGNSPPAGDINTPQTLDGRAWGFNASDAGFARAIRPFDGLLDVGQTFSLDFDNSTSGGSSSGFALSNANDSRFVFAFNPSVPQQMYVVNDATGSHTLGLAPTNQGLHVEFTLTSQSTYFASFTGLSGGSATISGSLRNSALPGIDRMSAELTGFASAHPDDAAYINNIRIVPEPAPYLLIIFASAVGAIWQMRRCY